MLGVVIVQQQDTVASIDSLFVYAQRSQAQLTMKEWRASCHVIHNASDFGQVLRHKSLFHIAGTCERDGGGACY